MLRSRLTVIFTVAFLAVLTCILFFPGLDETRDRVSVQVDWDDSAEIASVSGWYIVDTVKWGVAEHPLMLEQKLGEPHFVLRSPGKVSLPAVRSPWSNESRILASAAAIVVQFKDGRRLLLKENLHRWDNGDMRLWLDIPRDTKIPDGE